MERRRVIKTRLTANSFCKKLAAKDNNIEADATTSTHKKDLFVSKEELKKIEKSWDREIYS